MRITRVVETKNFTVTRFNRIKTVEKRNINERNSDYCIIFLGLITCNILRNREILKYITVVVRRVIGLKIKQYIRYNQKYIIILM